MSYILDALKKSERERKLRKTLVLDAPDSLPSLKSIARWPYIVAFVLVLNACFFAFRLYPWHRGNTDRNRSGVQLAQTGLQRDFVGPPAPLVPTADNPDFVGPPAPLAPTADKPDSSGKRPEEKEQSGPNPAQAVSSVAGAEKNDSRSNTESAAQSADAVGHPKTDVPATPDKVAVQDEVSENKHHAKGSGTKQDQKTGAHRPDHAPLQLSSVSPGQSGAAGAAAPKLDSSKPPQESKPAGTKQSPKGSKSPAALKKQAGSAEQSPQARTGSGIVSDLEDFTKLEASSSKPSTPAVPKWHELTSETRDAIPNLIVSMLIYSQNPENRWININGSKKREGQEISAGLRLEQITPDGAVFNYRGQRFFKGIVGD